MNATGMERSSTSAAAGGGRVPPQNLEAEACVLGSIMIDNEAAYLVFQHLQPEDFYKTAHRHVYEVIYELVGNDEAVDVVILEEALRKRGLLDKVGGPVYLLELAERVPTATNAEYYAKIVREKSVRRKLITVCGNIGRDAYDSEDQITSLLDDAERRFFEVTQLRSAKEAQSIQELLQETLARIETYTDGGLTGLSTGFYDLDAMTNGLQDSDMVILAARPSMGKTTLAVNIMRHIAVNLGEPVAFFSLEMANNQVVHNLLCMQAQVDSFKVRKGRLSSDEYARISTAASELSKARLFIDDTPGLTTMELRAKARRLKAQHDIKFIVIDYLQLMEAHGFDSRQQEISFISRGIKALARELGVPVVALSQLSRKVESRADNRPKLSDLRESGAIEQDADVVFLLYRPEYYKPEVEELRNKTELIIAKHRNGPTGTVNLVFLKEKLRFENEAHY